jgi:hypothetical protein
VAREPDDSATTVGEPGANVDIGLPCFRRATFLAEAIDSVLGQSYSSWSLAIFDNGASPEIESVVRPYLDDPRIAYVPSTEAMSLAANWTRALQHGRSEYFALLNDDDTWFPEFLAERVRALGAHPECGFAFGECMYLDAEGARPSEAWFEEGVVSSLALARSFTERNPVVPSAVLVRRAAVEHAGAVFDERWHYCDWEMWARLAAFQPAYFIARPDSVFRRHASTNTLAQRESPTQLMAMLDHIESTFERQVPDFHPSRGQRRKGRALILLRAAVDTHAGGGWRASGRLYRSAVRMHPGVIFRRPSLTMVAKSVLGKRVSRVVARGLHALDSVRGTDARGVR